MNNIRLFIICAFVLFLSGCVRDVKSSLDKAESCMDEHPEEALSLLDGIDRKALSTRKSRARHSLLYSMALDKNYIDTSDTGVAQPAVEYYDLHGPADKAMKAWFYLGREQENGGRYDDAIVSYTRARELSKESDDVRFKALLASGMADLYSKTYNHEELIASTEEVYRLYSQAGDTLNIWLSIGDLAIAYTFDRQFDKADSLFQVFFAHKNIDSSYIPYYQLNYARKCIMQPEPEAEKAIKLIDSLIHDYGTELSGFFYGLYAYANAMLGEFSVSDKYFAFLEESGPSGDIYDWKYDIYRERGDYKNALHELENVFRNQEEMINNILSQSISRTQRDYFQTKSELIEHDRNRQKSVKTIFVLVSLLVILSSSLIVISVRRNLQQANDRIASIQSESSLYSRELEKRIEAISKEELDRREKAISELNRSYIQNYRSQFKLIDELCSEYWMSERSRDKDKIYNKVKKIVSVIYDGSGKNTDFESRINSCLDNVMHKLRSDFPQWKEEDFRFLSYVIAGFEAKTISMIMGLSVSNVYSRKSRLKDKILSAPTDNTELYRACL